MLRFVSEGAFVASQMLLLFLPLLLLLLLQKNLRGHSGSKWMYFRDTVLSSFFGRLRKNFCRKKLCNSFSELRLKKFEGYPLQSDLTRSFEADKKKHLFKTKKFLKFSQIFFDSAGSCCCSNSSNSSKSPCPNVH